MSWHRLAAFLLLLLLLLVLPPPFSCPHSPSLPPSLSQIPTHSTRLAHATFPLFPCSHPWCASPSFTIPGLLLGAMPVSPGWAVWRLAPQPSDIAHISAQVPTPGGMVPITWDGTGVSNATVSVGVMEGQRVEVCLPLPGTAIQQQQHEREVERRGKGAAVSDSLYVDGSPVVGVPYGRLLCTPSLLAPGPHTVSRIAQ